MPPSYQPFQIPSQYLDKPVEQGSFDDYLKQARALVAQQQVNQMNEMRIAEEQRQQAAQAQIAESFKQQQPQNLEQVLPQLQDIFAQAGDSQGLLSVLGQRSQLERTQQTDKEQAMFRAMQAAQMGDPAYAEQFWLQNVPQGMPMPNFEKIRKQHQFNIPAGGTRYAMGENGEVVEVASAPAKEKDFKVQQFWDPETLQPVYATNPAEAQKYREMRFPTKRADAEEMQFAMGSKAEEEKDTGPNAVQRVLREVAQLTANIATPKEKKADGTPTPSPAPAPTPVPGGKPAEMPPPGLSFEEFQAWKRAKGK